jgi:UDP-N-acetylglucosamine--N-acetylmuramyl-(pentapeptide) pyrophosphoryl-undecaprenol N-acetylglucosamine transferase
MKVVIVGGHFSPALSVIQNLKDNEVFYVGRKYTFEGDKAVSFEYQEITRLGIPFFSLRTARLQRKFTKHTIPSFGKLPIGFFQSLLLLKKIKPDVVVSFGGYLSIPVGFAAYILKIPLVIHEQTFNVGFANKALAKFAKKICISWETSEKYFPKEKIVLTGNPIRREIVNGAVETRNKDLLPLIYITGGSSGAHVINQIIAKTVDKLSKKYEVIHQTGDSQRFKDYDLLTEIKSNLGEKFSKNYSIKKFLNAEESARTLKSADLVIGRSGVNTVTELIYLNKPALLIPITFSQKNEQLRNAEYMKDLGLAEILDENSLTEELFLVKIEYIFDNIKKYTSKKEIVFKNSAEEIVKVIEDVSKKKTT